MMNRISWQRITAIISLVALIFIVYAQVFHFGFINIDDSVYVIRNTHVLDGLSFGGVVWAFTSTYAGFWHPITWLSLMVDTQVYGTWVGGYHLTNLLLHVVSSLLLFAIFHKMTGAFWKSVLVAALFALHPLHVESVAWIAERKDVLSAFWWMLTIYGYVCYVENPGIKRYLLVLVLFFLGLMSKPMLVTLPFVLLLLDYWPLCRISFRWENRNIGNPQDKCFMPSKTASIRRLILEKIPLIIMVIPISIITFLAENKLGALPSINSYPMDMRIFNAIVSYVRYIEKAILPVNLSVYYPHPGMWPILQVILAGSFIIFLSFLIIRKLTLYPYFAVGWLWYLGTLIPVIGLIQVGPQAMADRYTYIPLIGLFVMFAWGVPDLMRRFPHKKIVLSFGAILLIMILSILSWQRCKLWGDNLALWDDVLKNYQVAFAYNIRGLTHAGQGQYGMALTDYNFALGLNKKFAEALSNRGNLYVAIGQYKNALNDYNQAINLKSQFADAHYNRGILYLKQNQFDTAIADFTAAIHIDPYNADYFNNRGLALRLKGEHKKAFADFNQALKINGNLAEAYYNRGMIFSLYKQHAFAIQEYNEALQRNPSYIDAYFGRGVSFFFIGQYDASIKEFLKVLSIEANHINALNNLGIILTAMKRYEEAAEQYKKILQLKPDNRDVLANLKEIERRKNKDNRLKQE